MAQNRSRKARIAAAAIGVAAVAAGSVFGINNPASAVESTDTAITKLSVKKGPLAGGTVVTITGKNFTGTIAAADVLFGATAATSAIVLSSTQIVAVAPAGTGTVQVKVTANTIASADTTADDYTYVTPITSTTGTAELLNPLGGSVISVTSDTSLGASATAFKALKVTATVGGVSAPVTWGSEFVAKVAAPAGTPTGTEVEVLLNLDGVTGLATGANVVKYAAVITGLSKTSGKVGGTGTVVVTGKGLTGATAWKFGAVSATCAATSTAKADTSWTCTIPDSGGVVAATVQVNFTPAGTVPFGTVGGGFTYTDVS